MFALRNFQTHAQTHTYTLNTHIENDLLIPSTTVAITYNGRLNIHFGVKILGKT